MLHWHKTLRTLMELASKVSELLSKGNYRQVDKADLLNLYKEVFSISLSPTCPNCISDAYYGLKHWSESKQRLENSKINLFTSYYQDKNPDRQKEIDFCLEQNRSSGYFNEVVVIYGKRPTFLDFFEATKKYPEDVNVIANSDIFFDHTILMAKEIKYNYCYALSRWDLKSNGNIYHHKHSDSQDVWIFRGQSKCDVGHFYLGVPGCDNRIAYELKKKYVVTNPSISIRPIHLHLTQIHNYSEKDKVSEPYAMVEPCQI